jgi:hypothetical protein
MFQHNFEFGGGTPISLRSLALALTPSHCWPDRLIKKKDKGQRTKEKGEKTKKRESIIL